MGLNAQGQGADKEAHGCMTLFNNEQDAVCLILIKSGTLILQGCSLSVESIKKNSLKYKVPCVYQMADTCSFIQKCSFRGGGLHKADTAGIYNKNGNSLIQNCQFHQFQSGGVIADLAARNIFVFRDNAIVSCSATGLYIEGEGSQPVILHNVFMVCKCSSIIINTRVDALIAMNEMQINGVGIEILNNKSIVFENTIQKCHDDGIAVRGTSESHLAQPTIQKNYIEASTHNGIVCEGFSSCPLIKANIIEANRKSGIKMIDSARAHIGGHTLSDREDKRSHLDFKAHASLYAQLFEDIVADGAYRDVMTIFYEVLEATAEFKEQVLQHLNEGKVPMDNLIHQNYCQGILLEEGCAADIISNHLIKNIKANIALGGQNSGDTKIKFNHIEKSKQEGIFVVEGEKDL